MFLCCEERSGGGENAQVWVFYWLIICCVNTDVSFPILGLQSAPQEWRVRGWGRRGHSSGVLAAEWSAGEFFCFRTNGFQLSPWITTSHSCVPALIPGGCQFKGRPPEGLSPSQLPILRFCQGQCVSVCVCVCVSVCVCTHTWMWVWQQGKKTSILWFIINVI